MEPGISLTGSLLIVGILLLIAGHTMSLVKRRKWLALDPLNAFWAGVLIVYIIQPVQFGEVFRRWHVPGVMEWALLWSLLGFVFVVLGYEASWGRAWGRCFPAMPARLRGARVAVFGTGLIGAGVFGYCYLIGTAPSVSDWFAVPRGGTDWAKANGYVATLSTFLPGGIAFLFFLVHSRRVWGWVKLLVWCLAWLGAAWFFYLGSRSLLIGMIIMMLAGYYLPRRRNPPAWLLLLTFLSLMLMVSFLGSYRENFTNLSFNLEELDFEEAGRRVLPGFLGGDSKLQRSQVAGGHDFNCVITVVELVPEEVDFNYGYCLLEFVTRPIPRAIWPEKRYPHYEAFTPLYQRGGLSRCEIRTSTRHFMLTGPAFTFVGHWYAVGGALALVVAGFLTGSLFRIIRTLYDRAPGNQGDQFLYFMVMPIGFGEAAATPLFWIFNLPYWIVAIGLLYLCRERAGRLVRTGTASGGTTGRRPSGLTQRS
jgi:hypothetical protein